jgi:hypothetical protein
MQPTQSRLLHRPSPLLLRPHATRLYWPSTGVSRQVWQTAEATKMLALPIFDRRLAAGVSSPSEGINVAFVLCTTHCQLIIKCV